MRQILVSIAISIVILGLGFMAFGGLSSAKPEPEKLENVVPIKRVKTRAVTNGTETTEIEVTGRLTARDRIDVFSEVGGTFIKGKKSFKEGVYFKKDEVMINIDKEEFELNLLAQKSSLMNQLTLLLPDLKTDFPDSFDKWQTYINKMELNQPLAKLPDPSTDRERYFLSARNIYNLYYTIQSQEKRATKYAVKAPFNGKVSESQITEGTLVRAGQRLGQFYNPYIYEMEAAVNLQDLKFIRSGSRVALSSDDISGTWKGVVARVSDVIDPQTQTVKVFITVTGNDLKEGMYLKGDVKGSSLQDVVELDRALVQDETIWIVKDDSTLAMHTIETVQYTTNTVMVKGIPNGTIIV
ncbi:MAG: efflux RND transporter periplasmic adaptor subunit, partial [Bacteroidota bacterium]